jgi:flavin reductase (DIM6/NTAB) family NADH-FMN oxidoreductase RutF
VERDADQEFRRAMGAFATGVTVVSAARPGAGLSGMTVNSLTSVSLQPRLLLWCLGDQSERYDTFAEAEHWGVTMLGRGGRSARAPLRARRNGNDPTA